MKILLGDFKGRNFYRPLGIRPIQNVVRKAVFDMLGHDLAGMDFLELFAGSGAVGLEAASLGAKRVVWVEHDPRCCKAIEDSLRVLNLNSYENSNPNYQLIPSDAFAAVKQLARLNKKFDVIYLDPPYGVELAKKILKTLNAYDILAPDCFVILQCYKSEILPEPEQGRFLLIKQKHYGASYLSVYKDKRSVS